MREQRVKRQRDFQRLVRRGVSEIQARVLPRKRGELLGVQGHAEGEDDEGTRQCIPRDSLILAERLEDIDDVCDGYPRWCTVQSIGIAIRPTNS